MQEGKESQDAFMASLTSKQDSKSLMPAASAFRMLSSVPGPEGVMCACAQNHASYWGVQGREDFRAVH